MPSRASASASSGSCCTGARGSGSPTCTSVVELIDRSEVSPGQSRDQSPDHDQSPDPNRDQSEVVARARARARAVISNHHNLLLALPGRAADWTAADRLRLAASFTSSTESIESPESIESIESTESTESPESTEQRKP